MIEFFTPFSVPSRFHWPMQGPQALARTVAPTASSFASWPSRSIVALTCSEPGVINSGVFSRNPFPAICSAMAAIFSISS